MKSIRQRLLAAAVLLVAAASTSLVQAQAAAPAQAPAQSPPQGQSVPAQPAQSATSPQYVIGPGDTLQVFVWDHPELTVTVPVRPDGQISTPLVENMVAAGRTASELARSLESRLTEYVRSPTVNVIVTAPLSTFSQVKGDRAGGTAAGSAVP